MPSRHRAGPPPFVRRSSGVAYRDAPEATLHGRKAGAVAPALHKLPLCVLAPLRERILLSLSAPSAFSLAARDGAGQKRAHSPDMSRTFVRERGQAAVSPAHE